MDGNKDNNFNFDFLNKELKFKSSTKFLKDKSLKKRRREEDIYGTFYGDIKDNSEKVNESKSNIYNRDNFPNWESGFDAEIEENEENNNIQARAATFLYSNFVKGEKLEPTKSKNFSSKKFDITMTIPQDKDSDEEVEKEFLKDYTADKIKISKNIKEEKKTEAKLKETFGKGYAMLKKIGYKLGSGLGKNEQGITVPIEIKKRKKNAGISNEKEDEDKSEKNILNTLNTISKLKEKHIEIGRNELDEFEKILENWDEIKEKLISSDVIDFEVDLKTQNYDVTQFIIDSRKKESQIMHKKGAFNNNLFDKESFLEEIDDSEKIKEDLVQVMKKSKSKISDCLSKIKSISDSTVNFNYEISNLNEELRRIELDKVKKEKFIKGLNHIKIEIENNLKTNSDNLENYKSLATHLIHLYDNNKIEYKKYPGLTAFCIETTEKFLNKFNFNDYLKKSKIIIPLLNEIKTLIDKTENEEEEDFLYEEDAKRNNEEYNPYPHIFAKSSKNIDDPDQIPKTEKLFGFFLNKIVINNLISYIINEWNVKEYELLHKVFEIYSNIIPNFIKDYLISSVLIPRLLEEIGEKWEPDFSYSTSEKPKLSNLVHLWIHPWLDLLKLDKLTPITKLIQEKIENKILSCDISNTNLIDILLPWKRIWEESYFDELNERYILPKLNFLFSKMKINPKDQDLGPIKILFKWNQSALLSMEKCLPILLNHFFPKWLQVLYDWLNKTSNSERKFEEIQKWYLGWKSLFNGNYLKFKEIEQEFKNALILITSS